MIRLEWVFILQIFTLVFMVILIQKLMQMKKQMNDITKEVMNYISYITEEIEEENVKCGTQKSKKRGQNECEEAQNRLIQAVLGDFFP